MPNANEMSIPDAGIIALIILACLSSVAIGAALFGHLSLPSRPVFGFSSDQQKYMRSVRLKRLGALQQDLRVRDIEGDSVMSENIASSAVH
ncbi:hypothetical protein BDW75DRAFT_242208 [Aspergillus navahoensis]